MANEKRTSLCITRSDARGGSSLFPGGFVRRSLYRTPAALAAGREVWLSTGCQVRLLSTPTEKEPAVKNPNQEPNQIDQERKLQLMDLLMQYHFEIKISELSDDDADKADAKDDDFTLCVIPGAGGSWSDDYSFTAGNADSYFRALEQAILSSIDKEQQEVYAWKTKTRTTRFTCS